VNAPDVVYFTRSGRNEELRYSLRSLVNLPHGRVVLIGDVPRWYRGDHIPFTTKGNKHLLTDLAMIEACENEELSDPFILMNDDFFIVKPIEKVPLLNIGTLAEVAGRYLVQVGRSSYQQRMVSTRQRLEELGYEDPLCFEAHAPLVVHKKIMREALALGGGMKRSMYGALLGKRGRQVRDPKIVSATSPIPSGPFWSSGDRSFPKLVRGHLEPMFPDKSPWEA